MIYKTKSAQFNCDAYLKYWQVGSRDNHIANTPNV